ncbi:hypothetical protein L249_5540 [Ophiocordyceps polyrhachis-furcata BCC 54312]|uniref:Alcohol dehydrogenase iron-type/glycerol dehydrogenase GldA domain-containing protein n=1 Tax=Ophiocordyceps polyrhachis-furcata BCC 54312 TaxID=1330021 RepID=A0A367LGC4_9HYPO|nr:hypothetical protein L249_5540 [Ophiocordyceps polyrhachis-furcata BCC 54312]
MKHSSIPVHNASSQPDISSVCCPTPDNFCVSPASVTSISSVASSASSLSSSAFSPSPAVDFPRVVYGPGAVTRLAQELGRLHASSPLIVSSPSRIRLARRIQTLIPNLDSRILDSTVVSVPAAAVDDALDRITDRDAVVSVGGASAVGLASAIGLRKIIPHICIPTTYSGSEMMPPLLGGSPARHVESSGSGSGSSSGSSPSSGSAASSIRRRKRHRHRHHHHRPSRLTPTSHHPVSAVRDPRIPPAVVIYDEELTAWSSRCVSAPSATTALERSTEMRPSPSTDQDTAPWSFLNLPGL